MTKDPRRGPIFNVSWEHYRQANPLLQEMRDYDLKVKVIDRYSALGIERPNPKTVCMGPCEGTGIVPVQADHANPPFRQLWQEAEDKEPSEDGWHFVTCNACEGSGKRKEESVHPCLEDLRTLL